MKVGLIDCEKMEKAIKDYFKGCIVTYGHTVDVVDTSKDVVGLVEMVAEAYPVDAVPVVRCKNCKYSCDFYHDGSIYCRRPHKTMEWHEDNPNYYCADGERKDGEVNG